MEDQKINVVFITFDHMDTLVLTKEEYNEMGKFNGLCKEYSINKRDVKEVRHKRIKTSEFPTTEWMG